MKPIKFTTVNRLPNTFRSVERYVINLARIEHRKLNKVAALTKRTPALLLNEIVQAAIADLSEKEVKK